MPMTGIPAGMMPPTLRPYPTMHRANEALAAPIQRRVMPKMAPGEEGMLGSLYRTVKAEDVIGGLDRVLGKTDYIPVSEAMRSGPYTGNLGAAAAGRSPLPGKLPRMYA